MWLKETEVTIVNVVPITLVIGLDVSVYKRRGDFYQSVTFGIITTKVHQLPVQLSHLLHSMVPTSIH